jgi:N-acetylglucosaminyl-diphospho-decaprenol L-rhamnosyltransferase
MLQSSFFYFPTLWEELLLVTHIGKRLNPYFPSHNGFGKLTGPVDWMSSASIVVRRSAMEQIGLIDEEYFIYSDETDWQYRLWQAGWEVHYLPQVNTIHFGGGSFGPGGRRYTLVYRGRMLFARKHYHPIYSIAQRMLFGAAALGRLGVWAIAQLNRQWRSLARRQIVANSEIIKLCHRLE